MDRPKLQHVMKNQPSGKRNPQRCLKRPLDCTSGTGTGHEKRERSTWKHEADDDDDDDTSPRGPVLIPQACTIKSVFYSTQLDIKFLRNSVPELGPTSAHGCERGEGRSSEQQPSGYQAAVYEPQDIRHTRFQRLEFQVRPDVCIICD